MVAEAEDAPDEGYLALPVRQISINQLVGFNLAYFRKSAGLTQEELGKRLGGWTKVAVSAAERSWSGNRIRKFDAHELTAMARALGVPLIALFLPPPDMGIAVRYVVNLPDNTGAADLMAILPDLVSALPEGAESYRSRIYSSGLFRVLDATSWRVGALADQTAAETLHQAQQEADNLVAEAHREADAVLAKAHREADAVLAKGRSPAVGQPVIDARREADETLGRARREADNILAKARGQAEQITLDARARAESLERDAQDRHRQAMGGLVAQREELERRVDELRAFEREYRSRFEEYLVGLLRDLRGGDPGDTGGFRAVDTGPSPETTGEGE
jgi:cell division septum initiation protein DivIVA/transcriptional regulator with XRE-family HTH domain